VSKEVAITKYCTSERLLFRYVDFIYVDFVYALLENVVVSQREAFHHQTLHIHSRNPPKRYWMQYDYKPFII